MRRPALRENCPHDFFLFWRFFLNSRSLVISRWIRISQFTFDMLWGRVKSINTQNFKSICQSVVELLTKMCFFTLDPANQTTLIKCSPKVNQFEVLVRGIMPEYLIKIRSGVFELWWVQTHTQTHTRQQLHNRFRLSAGDNYIML